MNADLDFLALLVQNFCEFSVFLVLGALAGVAFPLALLCKRMVESTGHYLPARVRQRRMLAYGLAIGACAALPLAVLFIGRWIDGTEHLQGPHAVTLIIASAATITYLLKRWTLIGGP